MPRKSKMVACAPCAPPEMSPEESKRRFQEDYGFNKRPSVRSPLSGWEQKYFDRGDRYMTPKKAVAMIEGSPHRFKHRRSGSVYGGKK